MARSHTENDNIEAPRISELQRDLRRIRTVDRMILLNILNNVLRILSGSDHDRHRIDAGIIDDQNTVRLQEVRVSLGLKSLESDKYICTSFLYNRLFHFVAVANKCNDRSASLRHTVNFRYLYVISCRQGDSAEDTAGDQGSLSAYTDNHNISGLHHSTSLIASKRQS